MGQCNTSQILGTTEIKSKFLSMRRQFTGLPEHTGVLLYFTLFQIDDNYLPNGSLSFTLGDKKYTEDNITNLTQLGSLRMNLCGNSSLDSSFVVELRDPSHTASVLEFGLHLNRMGKIGLNNLQFFLTNSKLGSTPPFEIETAPAYSVNTPAIKGLQVKLVFPKDFVNLQDVDSAFEVKVVPAPSAGRLLQNGYSNG